jgi:acyl-CoA synthetase (NDP forming)
MRYNTICRALLEPDAVHLLTSYEIPYPDHALARDADQATQIAEALGWPVVLKVVSADVSHKSDAGGVLVGLDCASQVREGYATVVERVLAAVPEASIEGVLVCKQSPPGLEVIVGALNDLTFGPTVMFGLGGIFAEVLQDVSFRVAPLSRYDAEEMIREIRGYPLLSGVRGQAPVDIAALAGLLQSVSRLVTEQIGVEELDLNPVRIFEHGLLVLDARVVVRDAETTSQDTATRVILYRAKGDAGRSHSL